MKKELLNNAKILCESIKKNKRQLYMSGFLIGWLTISGFNFYDLYESLEKTNEYNKNKQTHRCGEQTSCYNLKIFFK